MGRAGLKAPDVEDSHRRFEMHKDAHDDKDTHDKAAFIRRWVEAVWNKGREGGVDEMFAEDGVANGLVDESGEPLRGPEGFKPFFRRFREAFPEIDVTVDDTVCEGDKVAARCTVRGAHRGDSLGF